MQFTLHQLLKVMIDNNASDLHITSNTPPQLRIDGSMVPLKTDKLSPIETKQLCYSIMTDAQKMRFEEDQELDLSFGVKDLARFRANIFMQRGAVAGAFRLVPYQIRTLVELGVPPIVQSLCEKPRGLILVTGPTGSGKSTTLASMIDHINNTQRCHIITIEDPIEYLHHHKGCLVNQREIGADSQSFSRALKYILRQDPDVVLVGEMRDLETIEAALTIAETGHLAFATLHTNDAVQTINRVIDVFPAHQQSQIRLVLSFVLEGVICQSLIPKIGGGRVMACEVMIPNAAIRNLIREDKLQQVKSQMQIGQAKYGMQTLNQALCDLFLRQLISLEDAMSSSSDLDELKSLIAAAQDPAAVAKQQGQRAMPGRRPT
jgi:twitching motility protein PilT